MLALAGIASGELHEPALIESLASRSKMIGGDVQAWNLKHGVTSHTAAVP